MYHVIRNHHLDKVRQTAGPVLLVCRSGEDGGRLLRLMQQALGDRPLTIVTDEEMATMSPAADWVLPIHVVRSRFSRGEDRWSRWSRSLASHRAAWADRLNRWLGARIEVTCAAPVARTDTAGIQAAVAALAVDRPPPLIPSVAALWPGLRQTLAATTGTVTDDTLVQLHRMANQYHLVAATVLRGTVHYLSRRFFRGVWASGLAGIENLPANARIIYLPCHRSHFDYMVLPYALNELGQTCPIIAAGDNLNFFPIGRLLQTGFAFFIRRTFGNDGTYRSLCAGYIGESLRFGVPIAFFPEGGRSRDGWMRSPKHGMLQMCREQLDRNGDAGGPVYVVPVHVAYERCPDGKSLAKQSLGRAKRQESVFRFAKSLKMLVADHGRVFVTLGEPSPLTGVDGMTDTTAKTDTANLARHLLQRINAQAVVTGPALVAVALITRGYQAAVTDLTTDSALLAAYVEALVSATGWPVMLAPDETAGNTSHRGVVRIEDRTVGAAARDEGACRHDLALLGLGGQSKLVTCEQPIQRAGLDWHYGATGHLLAPLGIVARHLAQGGSLSAADLPVLVAAFDQARQEPTSRLHWPEDTPSATILAGVTAFLAQHGFCTPVADNGYTPGPAASPEVWQRWAILVPELEGTAPEGQPAATPLG
jgi:1-acyl-sn-glycerol-3-phosphate acyltransferase